MKRCASHSLGVVQDAVKLDLQVFVTKIVIVTPRSRSVDSVIGRNRNLLQL